MATTRKNVTRLRGRDKFFYELLMQERARVLGHFSVHQSNILDKTDNAEVERVGLSTHMADIGGDTFQHEVDLGLMSTEGEVIEMIEDAIERLVTGEYGICCECGAKIREERLKAKPYAIRCISCATKFEEACQ